MTRNLLLALVLLVATSVALTDRAEAQGQAGVPAQADTAKAEAAKAEAAKAEAAQGKTEEGAKAISGITILGNQEAPKSLVIVPWKSSEIGGSVGISTLLDDSRLPVDKDVFMRMLNYYEIRRKQ